jgi:hypothetical protein
VGNDLHHDDSHNYRSHGVVWKASGKIKALTPYDEESGSDLPHAINTHGAIVGSTSLPGGSEGVLWEPSGAVHLMKNLIDPNDPLKDRVRLQSGYAINRHGVIVVNGMLDGQLRAFRLLPL